MRTPVLQDSVYFVLPSTMVVSEGVERSEKTTVE